MNLPNIPNSGLLNNVPSDPEGYGASGEKFAEKLGIPKEEGDEFPDWQYYILNLVFRASGDFKQMCLAETKKWKETKFCIDT
jgi:hypothetical protein